MDNTLIWILWGTTLLLAGWVVVDALLKPQKLLEWPFLCSVMWLYFYVYMAYDAIVYFNDYITPRAFILGQLMPLLSLGAIVYGWYLAGLKSRPASQPYETIQSSLLIWFIGLVLICIGAIGGYMVQAGWKSGGYDYENTSAYVYLLFYVGYPGMALSLWVVSCRSDSKRKLLLTITLAAVAVFLYPHVSYLRRGPTFPAVLLLIMVPPLATRRAPSRMFYYGGLMAVGVVMLAYLQMRKIIYNEGTWQEALSQLSIEEAITGRGKQLSDNEYVNNCHMIEALATNGKYQYGTGHGSLFLHWIPRSEWKGKPALGEGIYTHDELLEDVATSAGVKLLGGGAAAGGVADTFIQYGFLTPLFFLALGYLVSKAYWKGQREGNILYIHGYIAVLCATHWLVSQGFAAAFVPMLAFLLIPLVVLRFIGQVRPANPNTVRH